MRSLLAGAISKRTNLRFEFSDETVVIDADAAQVRQIVMNLILNGSEALAGEDGTVTVRTGIVEATHKELARYNLTDGVPPGRYAFLNVSDDGCGMDSADRARIFDPFFTTKATGRGLGMAAVLGIVRRHRGAISVESEPGRGSSFSILFPLSDDPADRACGELEPDAVGAAGFVVLVVDD